MTIQELVSVGSKTTMKIGGQARYFAEVMTKEELEEATAFAKAKHVPLIILGAGSNTVFADDIIEALVIRIKAANVIVHPDSDRVTVEAGVYLAMLINDLAKQGKDLSPLTGIPGTIGGAIFGNAGQGAGGIWIDHYTESVEVFLDGTWKTMTREECNFRYRESIFKDLTQSSQLKAHSSPPIIWSATFRIPHGEPTAIQAEVERLLQKRIDTQPHVKTAGSCFKSLPDGTPAWKLIEAAGLRGLHIGGIQVSEKHANFLLNVDKGSFDDLVAVTQKIREAVPQIASIEMRLYGKDGRIVS
jgi:UDP-N-acetylmuramate dehydrogenase